MESNITLHFRQNGKAFSGTVLIETEGGEALVREVCLSRPEKITAFINEATRAFPGLDPEELRRWLSKKAAEEFRRVEAREAQQSQEQDKGEQTGLEPNEADYAAADAMLRSENLLAEVLDDIEAVGVVGERVLSATVFLVAVSRLLPKPLSLLIQGGSSAGKTFVPTKVMSLFPPEAYCELTELTPRSLYYAENVGIKHKVLLLGERRRATTEEDIDSSKAMRELIESGGLAILSTTKEDGKLIARRFVVEGPAAVIQSCSHDLVAKEDLNRVVVVTPDETAEQTKRVVARVFREAAGEGQNTDIAGIRRKHYALQRRLAPHEVLLPRSLADLLIEHFPTTSLEARRAASRVVTLMQASCLLHQYQRERDAHGRLLCNHDDYRLARHLLNSWLQSSVGGGLPANALRLWRIVQDSGAERERSVSELAKLIGASGKSTLRWARALCDAGLWEQTTPPGERPLKFRPTPGRVPDELTVLPDLPE
jgi:hypothetical protein